MREAKNIAEGAGINLQELAESVVSSARDLADAAEGAVEVGREKVRVAAERATSSVRIAAERASSSARDVTAQARRLIELLEQAPTDAKDKDRLLLRFLDALPIVSGQLDREANAVVVGYLGEAGVGVQAVRGVEIRYVRGGEDHPPLLRVSRIEGRGARLSAGAATSGYAGCLYGQPEVISSSVSRRGADVGVAVAGFSFFSATLPGAQVSAGGWWLSLNAGLTLGVPILSDLGAFELEEVELGSFDVDPVGAERVEAILAAAPDRSWRRGLAKRLAT